MDAPLKPRVTAAVLVEHDGKYLLGERNKNNYNGYWVIPGGGLHFGELLKDAALREIKEETGLDVEIKRFIGFYEAMWTDQGYHSIIFLYLAVPKDKNAELIVKTDKKDIAKAGFFTIDEIKTMKLAESATWALQQIKVLEGNDDNILIVK